MGAPTLWGDADLLASAAALAVGGHEVSLRRGPPLRVQVTVALATRATPMPILIGAAYPVRRGPQGPCWGAARLAAALGDGVVITDPTCYLDRGAGLRWYREGGREAMVAVARTVARLTGGPPLVVAGGHLVVPALEVAAAVGGTALVWNPGSDDISPAGLRATARTPAYAGADEGVDWCDVDLPPRLLVVQNADDPALAGVVGPFLDENEMVARGPGAYAQGDDQVVAFPALGAGVTELEPTALHTAVRALSAPGASVWDAHRVVVESGTWGSVRAPVDLRGTAADIVAAVTLDVTAADEVTAELRWTGALPGGLTRELVAYGRTGRLRNAQSADPDRSTWPHSPGVTHVVAHLVDECGHEIATLRRTAPFTVDERR